MMRRLALSLAVLIFCAGCDGPSRQDEVADRGAEVMPFDLDETMHVFRDEPYGGVQQVVAVDASDTTQIGLIRDHLRKEAERFSAGDFSDPAQIHGHEMPGLAELSEGAENLRLEYSDLADGGQIRYESEDSALVGALHRWFEAQRSDHGRHTHPHSQSH